MYALVSYQDGAGKELTKFHHVKLTSEFRQDCLMWLVFLDNCSHRSMCRPFTDLDQFQYAEELNFYTDSSGKIGYGGVFGTSWCYGFWDPEFLERCNPSIEYLELFALEACMLTWGNQITDTKIVIFCDNKSVWGMVNQTTSGCKNCMVLMRLLVLNGILFNRRVSVKYVKSAENVLADVLSRGDLAKFWRKAPLDMKKIPDRIPEFMWPVDKIWLN